VARSRVLSLLHRVLLGVAAAVLFGVVMWLAIKVVPGELARTEGISDASKRAEEIGRTRTAVLAMLAGTLAALGAYYTHRSFGLNRETLTLTCWSRWIPSVSTVAASGRFASGANP
jgi:ABC-type uncharacterized transport system permease subunit